MKAKVSVGNKLSNIGYEITDHKGKVLKKEEGKGRFALSSKDKYSKGLKKRGASYSPQEKALRMKAVHESEDK